MTPVRVNGSRDAGLRAGYFQMRLRDGTVGDFYRRTDDCVQAAIATLLPVPPWLMPDLRVSEQLRQGLILS
jgi:hypothetical protein